MEGGHLIGKIAAGDDEWAKKYLYVDTYRQEIVT